ncbi:sensor histidine kinase [Gordonia sp. (in: high G+C Gram-positive bacteria)]|uniref:sensor histidine kinase n=1 Tax=Gordonia sp. (in: high G+C Gram-positive bacteria) TaxID=84139 RepID=UPI003526C6A6
MTAASPQAASAPPSVVPPPPARARRRGIPLRISLVALTLALVVVGLVASGVAVTSAMRSDLMNRVDGSLVEATNTWARPLPQPGDGTPDHRPGPRRPPSNFFVQLSAGNEQFTVSDYDWLPDLSSLPNGDIGPRTVPSASGGPDWRVIQRTNGTSSVVVATPLKDLDDTLSRLIWLQAGIGLLVVAALGLLSYLLVNSSLRPLRRVEETAHAIAGGESNQRVPEFRQGTEVASLASSLNAMLSQIDSAFAATRASEQQARASAERARGSEDRMRRFVADASHELRTPLTSIKGFSDLIRAGMMPDPADGVARISAEADRMSLLVEDLLMLARLDAQRPLAKSPVDIPGLVDDAVAAARAAAPDREIIVVDRTDRDLPPYVEGDPARLTQVLRNLIGNAITHAPEPAPIIVELSADDHRVRVEVIDQGPGLSEDDADRVFERFYRGDDSRHRDSSSGGSGLGLSIVAALIAAHDGTVGVASRQGEGARFWFVLPRLDLPE